MTLGTLSYDSLVNYKLKESFRMLIEERFIYETYLSYRNLDKFKDDENFNELKEVKELNFKIFTENEQLCKLIYKINDKASIQELEYKSFNLIYIIKEKNIFLVNVFKKGEEYPKDLSVIFYKLVIESDFIRKIQFRNKEYYCMNVGKAFIEFNNSKGFEQTHLKRNRNKIFWDSFEEFLNDKSDIHYFGYCEINNVIIVYTYKHRCKYKKLNSQDNCMTSL